MYVFTKKKHTSIYPLSRIHNTGKFTFKIFYENKYKTI
jgi:hypothetical protein